MKRIFISSVQREFERERAAIKRMVETDPIFKAHFSMFVFESDAPAADKTTKAVFLEELARSDIYLALIGETYGFEDDEGISPTEREYDRAKDLGIPKFVFVSGGDSLKRERKEADFLQKISREVTWSSFTGETTAERIDVLLNMVRNCLRDLMLADGTLTERPFEDRIPRDVSLDDIDESKIRWFVTASKRIRKSKYRADASIEDVLRTLHLLDKSTNLPTNAALLLFGRDPQLALPSSEIKCACYPGVEKCKPTIDIDVLEGDIFHMADDALGFVRKHLNYGAGAHDSGPAADDIEEIPTSVIAEAINNAIAHRDYSSPGSVQIEVYRDRVEVISPGGLCRNLTIDDLYSKHESFPRNPRIAGAMYLVRYIEKQGTGITDLLDTCEKRGLRRPLMEENAAKFRIVLWRNPSTESRIEGINEGINEGLTEGLSSLLSLVKNKPGKRTRELAALLGKSSQTLERYLKTLKEKGLVEFRGAKRNGGYYCIDGGAQ